MSPIIHLENVDLYYHEEGAGTSIVLLHGLTLSGLMWTPQIKVFSNSFRVITPDLRGHGKSSAPKHSYTLHDYALDLKQLFDKINITEVHIIGLSLGGAVATEFSIAFPDMVLSTVLISSMPPRFMPGERWDNTVKKFRRVMHDKGIKNAVENVLLKEPVFGKINVGLNDFMNVKNTVREFSGYPLKENFVNERDSSRIMRMLSTLKIPFLIITGENDYKRFHEIADALSASLRNSRRVTIKNAGHLCTMEQPDDVNREILKFLG